MPTTPLPAVEAAAEGLRGTLALARALALAGRRVDLAGLDREMAVLCAAALALPPGAHAPARRALLGLRREVEALLATLPPEAPPPGQD
jgi:hypothetical protein